MTDSKIRASQICDCIKARATYYAAALVRLALVLENSQYVLHSAVVTFLEEDDETKDEERDYGELLLVGKQLESMSVCGLVNRLVEEGVLVIEGLPTFEAKGDIREDLLFVPSRRRLGYVESDWPMKYSECQITGAPRITLPSEPLVSIDLPLYPSGHQAVTDFLKIRSPPPRSILFQIPDYRARIANLNIAGRRVRLEIESNINADTLRAKFYGEFESSSTHIEDLVAHSPSLSFKGNIVEFEFDREPKYVFSLVMDGKTGEKLDYRGYHFDWPSPEGVTIEPVEIREMIRRGENLKVEFKSDLSDEFLETVVAFANTKGGIIFLGVSDDSRILGFEPRSKDQISNLIASNIEPRLEYTVRRREVDEHPLTIVEVPEGDDKPYSDRQLGAYVRSGSTDRRATRPDLDEMYTKRGITPRYQY